MIKKPPTIQDVARHANVSAATVSRALSSPERVSEATRARITAAVRDTGYAVNQAARSLRLRAARTILIALPNIGNPFYSTILDAVVHEAASRGYGVLVATPLNGNPVHWVTEYFSSNRVDGLLLFDGSVETKNLHGVEGGGGHVPMVVAYDELPDPLANAVLIDNRAAAELAVGHLLDLGHTRIGHIKGHSRNKEPNERVVGFRNKMASAGLPVREDWIFPGDYTMASGVAAGHKYLALKERPTAMFCGNDEEAIGFISVLKANNVLCPRDISVIGFDDIAVSEHYDPPLTTMGHPREEIGRRATETLLDLLEGRPTPQKPVRIVLKSQLIVRKSTAPIR